MMENTLEGVFSGILPKRVILALQPITRVEGHSNENPFHFQGHHLEKIAVEGDIGKYELDMAGLKQREGYIFNLHQRKTRLWQGE